ncbi:hypothetical protein IFM89_020728 [Coptis chinensis]|uniref:20 kDa chaperonin, chloroplastic n=1 Tax=Coptis chinensis TaxID=261450 RepID=A0A835IB56_9MAGN|nr:hypothetical protein IFM89_020728 [Coptis chinensis]
MHHPNPNRQDTQDSVLVKIKSAEEKTVGGILLPSTARSKPKGGEVVAVGEGKTLGKNKLEITTGAQIVYSKYAGTELEFYGSTHLLLKEDDIVDIYTLIDEELTVEDLPFIPDCLSSLTDLRPHAALMLVSRLWISFIGRFKMVIWKMTLWVFLRLTKSNKTAGGLFLTEASKDKPSIGTNAAEKEKSGPPIPTFQRSSLIGATSSQNNQLISKPLFTCNELSCINPTQPRQLQFIFSSNRGDLHSPATIIAGSFILVALVLSIFSIFQHLRSYTNPAVKSVTGSKILCILKAHGLAPEIPEDLYHLIKKAVAIRKHLERNRKDKDNKFRLILVESRIHRLARYYKRTKKLPPVWK